MDSLYDEAFFAGHRAASLESARQIAPYLVELLGCRSVVDVGCGLGAWLSAFQELGLSDLRGIDGDYVKEEQLLISPAQFRRADLQVPLVPDRQFDLALSLEVAEHLPAACSQDFVGLLTGFSSAVLFSASVPFQDGTGHINEQWLEYWVDLFRQRGYVAVDCLRSRYWHDPKVAWWYAQNTVLYLSEAHLSEYPAVESCSRRLPPPLTCIHPQLLVHKQRTLEKLPTLKDHWKSAFTRTWRKLSPFSDA